MEVLTVVAFAARCGVTPQAVRGWLRAGVALPLGARADSAPGRNTLIVVPAPERPAA